ncbi:MAG: transporter substrate-binding domain-containing protein [bacterium]
MVQGADEAEAAVTRAALAAALAAAVVAFGAVGCARRDEARGAPGRGLPAGGLTLSQEILGKISARVLDGVPQTPRLRQARESGVLHVALSPSEPPFQYVDGDTGAPAGFNVDLAGEIARILGVKSNVTIGGRDDASGESADVYFAGAGEDACAGGEGTPYFYSGRGKGWRRICAGGGDEGVAEAVGRVLDYLNETGIYARLYRRYFHEAGEHI